MPAFSRGPHKGTRGREVRIVGFTTLLGLFGVPNLHDDLAEGLKAVSAEKGSDVPIKLQNVEAVLCIFDRKRPISERRSHAHLG